MQPATINVLHLCDYSVMSEFSPSFLSAGFAFSFLFFALETDFLLHDPCTPGPTILTTIICQHCPEPTQGRQIYRKQFSLQGFLYHHLPDTLPLPGFRLSVQTECRRGAAPLRSVIVFQRAIRHAGGHRLHPIGLSCQRHDTGLLCRCISGDRFFAEGIWETCGERWSGVESEPPLV